MFINTIMKTIEKAVRLYKRGEMLDKNRSVVFDATELTWDEIATLMA